MFRLHAPDYIRMVDGDVARAEELAAEFEKNLDAALNEYPGRWNQGGNVPTEPPNRADSETSDSERTTKTNPAGELSFRMDRLPGWLHPETAAVVARLAAERGGIVWHWTFGRGERAVLRHRQPIPASLWAERHRVVHLSSRPGPWRNMVTPYAAGTWTRPFFLPSARKAS